MSSRSQTRASSVSVQRRLTEAEYEILQFLLAEPFPGRDQLRRQLELARVVAEPAEGLGTVEIEVDRAAEPTPAGALTVPVEAVGRDRDGMPILVVLHAPDGYLSELEIVRFDGEPPRAMPEPSALTRTINRLPAVAR